MCGSECHKEKNQIWAKKVTFDTYFPAVWIKLNKRCLTRNDTQQEGHDSSTVTVTQQFASLEPG